MTYSFLSRTAAAAAGEFVVSPPPPPPEKGIKSMSLSKSPIRCCVSLLPPSKNLCHFRMIYMFVLPPHVQEKRQRSNMKVISDMTYILLFRRRRLGREKAKTKKKKKKCMSFSLRPRGLCFRRLSEMTYIFVWIFFVGFAATAEKSSIAFTRLLCPGMVLC